MKLEKLIIKKHFNKEFFMELFKSFIHLEKFGLMFNMKMVKNKALNKNFQKQAKLFQVLIFKKISAKEYKINFSTLDNYFKDLFITAENYTVKLFNFIKTGKKDKQLIT